MEKELNLNYGMYKNDTYISSLHVAHSLKKKHSDVLSKIRELDDYLYHYKQWNDFKLFKGTYSDKQNKQRPLYLFNRLFMLKLLSSYENKNNYKEIYNLILEVSEFELSNFKYGFDYTNNIDYESYEDCNAHFIKLEYAVDVTI